MDSAVALAEARALGFTCHALSFDYGQRHGLELVAARRVADLGGAIDHRVVALDLRAIGGSSLTDDVDVPKDRPHAAIGIGVPSTYVPARNTVFLSIALGFAEVVGARDLFLGVNAVDYSGYPDCRPEFLRAFEDLARVATAAGAERGERFTVHAPLAALSKAGIVRRGIELGVDFGLTHTCYDPIARADVVFACGHCDACQLRLRGFAEAGVHDPIPYADERAPRSELTEKTMTARDPKPTLTPKELEAKLIVLIKRDKLNQAILLMANEKGVPQGVASSLVEDLRKRISSG